MIANKITIEFNQIKDFIKEAYIAVGMITDEKFDFFSRNLQKDCTVNLITGIHLPTSPSVLKKLMESSKINSKIYTKKFFHPKLYLFKLNDGWLAYVGSGNFTNGGWHGNEELFVKINNQIDCEELKLKFDLWYSEAIVITDNVLEIYSQTFNANLPKQKETTKNLSQFLDFVNNRFNIDNIDFSDQFFQKNHHLAFEPQKTFLESEEILSERREVRNRLYELNDLIIQKTPKGWDIHPHYEVAHVVSHIENNLHHDYNVRGLWVAYGRNKQNLKKYGDWATPLQFMRIQVIIHYNNIGIWLMPGKQGAGQIDREYFSKMMLDSSYREIFFNALKKLGKDYWIEVSGENIYVNSFKTSDELWEFTKNDNWRNYYFIIGKDFELGLGEFKINNIQATVLNEFEKLYAIYSLMLDKTLDTHLIVS